MTDGKWVTTGEYDSKKPTVWAKKVRIGRLFLMKKEKQAMNEMQLKYGCNPNQKPARVFIQNGDLPIKVLNSKPGYINLLDALNGWQLVCELKEATKLPAAASFKHVSPAGAAVATPISERIKKICFVDDLELSPLATAYARARGADRMSSYGDFIALSDVCDVSTADLIKREVSDGVIAPGYEPKALEILKSKRKGNYTVIEIDKNYKPEPTEKKQVFGVTFEQGRNDVKISEDVLKNIPTKNKNIPENAKLDLLISLIVLKFTQSNSVCYVKDGMAIGIGAGQQSRIHCTRLAGDKADKWYLRQCPKVLALPFKADVRRPDRDNAIDVYLSDDYEDVLADGCWQAVFTEKPLVMTREERKEWIKTLHGVSVGSDAFFPFGDNIERAHRSGADYIAETGGSIRDDNVIETADKYNIAMAFTGVRLFHH
jgi:phosphoribosylaminoimidazolecarboxamide formyltransferase/IMP cyclohydrolase/phosphoribosylaminoimidazolecarboxamide formyltransferase